MSRKISALVVLIIILVGLNYGIGYIAGLTIKELINKHSQNLIQTPISVENVSVNPALLLFTFKEIRIKSLASHEASSEGISVERITLNVEWMPIFFRKLIIKNLNITRPDFVIKRDKKNEFLIVPSIALSALTVPASRSFKTKKYPPATIENAFITGGSIGYADGSNRIDFNNAEISVYRFWRSVDRKIIQLSFMVRTELGENKGALYMEGDYSYENNKHAFTGTANADSVEIQYIAPFLKETIPVQFKSGYLTINAKPLCSENTLNTIMHFNIDRLNIAPVYKNQKIGGLPVSMIQEFLVSTGGSLRSDLNITGTLQNPEINLNEMLSQIISQKLQNDVIDKIDKKAFRAAKKLTEKLKKSLNK